MYSDKLKAQCTNFICYYLIISSVTCSSQQNTVFQLGSCSTNFIPLFHMFQLFISWSVDVGRLCS